MAKPPRHTTNKGERAGRSDRRFSRPENPALVALRALHTVLQFCKASADEEELQILDETLTEVEEAIRSMSGVTMEDINEAQVPPHFPKG